jgi:site-specific DNA recombinase
MSQMKGQAEGPIPAVLCTRVSTVTQAVHGTSLEEQLEQCAASIVAHGGYVAYTCTDAGVSGTFYESRSGLQEALAHIEAGRAKILCFNKVDRSGRDVDVCRAIQKRVNRAGGIFLIADQGIIPQTPIGRWMFTSQAANAEFLRETILENTAKGRRRRATEGKQPSRNRSPYGYLVVTVPDTLTYGLPQELVGQYIVVADEAEVVYRIFRRIAEGASLRSVAGELNAEGIPTPGVNYPPYLSSVWTNSTISRLIRHPVYKGEAVFGRRKHYQDSARLTQGYKSPRYNVPADPSQWVHLDAPILVPVALWETANALLDENQSRIGGTPNRVYLLAGLVDCPECGTNMTGLTNTPGQARKERGHTAATRYYRCAVAQSKREQKGVKQCASPYFNGPSVESLVFAAVRFAASQPEALKDAVRGFQMAQKAMEATDETREALALVERQEARLTDLSRRERATVEAQIAGIAAGADPSVYSAKISEIATERVAAQEELTKARQMLAAQKPKGERPYLPDAVEALARHAQMVDIALSAPDDVADITRKRNLLSLVIEKTIPRRGGKQSALATGVAVYFRLSDVRSASGASSIQSSVPLAETEALKRRTRSGVFYEMVRAGQYSGNPDPLPPVSGPTTGSGGGRR